MRTVLNIFFVLSLITFSVGQSNATSTLPVGMRLCPAITGINIIKSHDMIAKVKFLGADHFPSSSVQYSKDGEVVAFSMTDYRGHSNYRYEVISSTPKFKDDIINVKIRHYQYFTPRERHDFYEPEEWLVLDKVDDIWQLAGWCSSTEKVMGLYQVFREYELALHNELESGNDSAYLLEEIREIRQVMSPVNYEGSEKAHPNGGGWYEYPYYISWWPSAFDKRRIKQLPKILRIQKYEAMVLTGLFVPTKIVDMYLSDE